MRKPTFPKNPFALPKAKKPKALTLPKVEKPPAPRRIDFERTLRDAIEKEKLVSLKYPGDIQAREFEPGAVYYSSRNPQKVNVGGCQITNPNDTRENMQPHVFEVGKIVSLALTEKPFVVREGIDVRDPRYVNGFICYFQKP